MFCASADQLIKNVYKYDKDGSLLKNVLELYSAGGREQKTKQNYKFFIENLFNLFKGFQCWHVRKYPLM